MHSPTQSLTHAWLPLRWRHLPALQRWTSCLASACQRRHSTACWSPSPPTRQCAASLWGGLSCRCKLAVRLALLEPTSVTRATATLLAGAASAATASHCCCCCCQSLLLLELLLPVTVAAASHCFCGGMHACSLASFAYMARSGYKVIKLVRPMFRCFRPQMLEKHTDFQKNFPLNTTFFSQHTTPSPALTNQLGISRSDRRGLHAPSQSSVKHEPASTQDKHDGGKQATTSTRLSSPLSCRLSRQGARQLPPAPPPHRLSRAPSQAAPPRAAAPPMLAPLWAAWLAAWLQSPSSLCLSLSSSCGGGGAPKAVAKSRSRTPTRW